MRREERTGGIDESDEDEDEDSGLVEEGGGGVNSASEVGIVGRRRDGVRGSDLVGVE